MAFSMMRILANFLWQRARRCGGRRELDRVFLAILLFASIIFVALMRNPLPILRLDLKEARLWRDSRMFFNWKGFGPEKGLYNFTVVTAMLDIGRDNWIHQSRAFNEYLLYMQRVLRLDVNMVVYIDVKGKPMVEWMRRGREARTRIIETRIEDVPYYKYRSRIQEVMDSEEYRRDNELVRKRLCEATIPEYDILQWGKLYFLNDVIERNPFQTDYFVWIDGGYGRGEEIHPKQGVWKPFKLFDHMDEVTFLEREDVEHYRTKVGRLHKMSINIIPGGFFGGGARALKRLYALQQQLVIDWLDSGMVDDDQTMYMQLYYKHPELFNLVRADWYDAFRLFVKD